MGNDNIERRQSWNGDDQIGEYGIGEQVDMGVSFRRTQIHCVSYGRGVVSVVAENWGWNSLLTRLSIEN